MIKFTKAKEDFDWFVFYQSKDKKDWSVFFMYVERENEYCSCHDKCDECYTEGLPLIGLQFVSKRFYKHAWEIEKTVKFNWELTLFWFGTHYTWTDKPKEVSNG